MGMSMENFNTRPLRKPEAPAIESGASSFGIRKSGDTFEITGLSHASDSHAHEVMIRLPHELGARIFSMLKTQHRFETEPSGTHRRREVLGGIPYTVSKGKHGSDTSPAAMDAEQVYHAYCHQTAAELLPAHTEGAYSLKPEPTSLESLKHKLLTPNNSSPRLIQIFQDTNHGAHAPQKVHSLIVLGHPEDKRDPIICFEKMGYGLPYRITTIEHVWRYWERLTQRTDQKLLIVCS